MKTLVSRWKVKHSLLLFTSTLLLNHSKIFASEEQSEKHVRFAPFPPRNHESHLMRVLKKEKKKVMEIIEPGRSPNYGHWPDSPEEIKQRSIKIWQNYTINECIEKLDQVSKALECIVRYCCQNSCEIGRSYHAMMHHINGIYLEAFRNVKNNSAKIDPMINALEGLFSKHPEQNCKRNIFYAVEQKLYFEVQASSTNS